MTLAAHQFTVADESGDVVAGAHVEVRSELPGQPLAAVYSDRAGLSGLGNPFDCDADGFVRFFVVGGYYQIRVYTGPSGAPTFEAPLYRYVGIGLAQGSDYIPPAFVVREITAAGAITVNTDDDVILVKKTVGAATSVVLPNPLLFTKRKIRIVDRKYDAATNNITITSFDSSSPPVAVTIMGGASYVIDSNGASIELTPLSDGSGWI